MKGFNGSLVVVVEVVVEVVEVVRIIYSSHRTFDNLCIYI